MVGTWQGQIMVLTRENSRDGAARACYYATL